MKLTLTKTLPYYCVYIIIILYHKFTHSLCSLVARLSPACHCYTEKTMLKKNSIEKLLCITEKLVLIVGTRIHTHTHTLTHSRAPLRMMVS